MSLVTDKRLSEVYPGFLENSGYYKKRIEQVSKGFKCTFCENKNRVRIFSAPGRSEIGGNHTDHQHGCVLAAAIDMDVLAAAAPNGKNSIRLLSEGYQMIEILLNNLTPVRSEGNTTSALVRGTAARLTEMGYEIKGFDAYIISDVIKGSGLSSSAAFEVVLGVIMNNLFCEGRINAVAIAQVGQYAENMFFGKPSGLMDQTASSVGGVVFIDFNNIKVPAVRKLNFDFSKSGYALCIINSGASHEDLTAEYSAIPSEMKSVAGAVGKDVLRETDINEILENISEVRRVAGDRGVLRAIHFFFDNERAVKEAEFLERGDYDEFLSLINESGQSSWMYLQNVSMSGSSRHQEVAYTLAMCAIILNGRGACRVHGGGFAGTIQAFVPLDMLEEFKSKIERAINKGCCHILSIRNEGGTELTEGE